MAEEKLMDSEWSYLFDADSLDDVAVDLMISPSEDERVRVARRLDIVSLDAFSARIRVHKAAGTLEVHVSGSFEAKVTQNCVVSGDPVYSVLAEPFEGWFADKDVAVSLAQVRKEKLIEKGRTELPILEERDDPEPIIEGMIDLGELCVQHLSLAINPYPHAEGVHFEVGDEDSQGSAFSFKNPFAALKDWKVKQGEKD